MVLDLVCRHTHTWFLDYQYTCYLLFAAKSVRTRMIHDLRMQRAMRSRLFVRTSTSPPPPLSLSVQYKKGKACLFYTVRKERRESRRRRARAGSDTSRLIRHVRYVTFARSAEWITVT